MYSKYPIIVGFRNQSNDLNGPFLVNDILTKGVRTSYLIGLEGGGRHTMDKVPIHWRAKETLMHGENI